MKRHARTVLAAPVALLLSVSCGGGSATRGVIVQPSSADATVTIAAVHHDVTAGRRTAVELVDLVPRPAVVEEPPAGAVARFSGSLTRSSAGAKDARGKPVAGSVEFVAGPNAGLRLRSDEEGNFGHEALHPGLAVVRVAAGGVQPFEREVSLRTYGSAPLHLDFGSPLLVEGKVVNRHGFPLAGATVSLDGNEARTDGAGTFLIAGRASGDTHVVVAQDGFAPRRIRVRERRGTRASDEPVPLAPVALDPACRLVVTVGGAPSGSDGEVQLLFAPVRGHEPVPRDPRGLRVASGGTLVLDDLPPTTVGIRAFHPLAKGEVREVRLDPRIAREIHIDLEPADLITGCVSVHGEPLANARIVLEADNRTRANAATLGDAAGLRMTLPIGDLPAARHEARTDEHGRFTLGWWDAGRTDKVLRVDGDDGTVLHRESIEDRPSSLDVSLVLGG